MNVTEPIIQTALLGTANREFVPADLPAPLAELTARIREKSEDTESCLYRTAAAAFAYRHSGWEPGSSEGLLPIETAPEERLPYFDRDRCRLLARLQGTQNMAVYAYRRARNSGRVILPEFLQPLIRRAYNRNNPMRFEERRLLTVLGGERGVWLLRQMGLADGDGGEETSWDTATHSERRDLLRRQREENPSSALELLRRDWKSEPANHRNDLLECLLTNLSRADETFLMEVISTDRSSTVRETARKLLCRIPDSAMVSRCCELLRGHIRYRKLIGWSYDRMEYTPELKEMGLEEISRNKQEDDSEFLLRQLAERVPLGFWCEVFDCGEEQAARKLAKHPPFRKHFNLEELILNFSDRQWAFHTLQEAPYYYFRRPELVGMLTPSQREEIKWPDKVKQFTYIHDSWFGPVDEPWGPGFSSAVLSWIFNQEYVCYVNDTAENLALHLSPHLRDEVCARALALTDGVPSIREFCTRLQEFMDLKSEIDNLFND